MRSETDVRAGIARIDAELQRLDAQIAALLPNLQHRDGDCRAVIERLAACYRRRRALHETRDTLGWVVADTMQQRAG